MTGMTVEDRAAERLVKDLTVFVELQSRDETDAEEADIVICNSVDLSRTGLQLVIDRPIPDGQILRLCLDVIGMEPVFVVAKVMWSSQRKGSMEYNIGFMLLNSKGTDFNDWQRVIERD